MPLKLVAESSHVLQQQTIMDPMIAQSGDVGLPDSGWAPLFNSVQSPWIHGCRHSLIVIGSSIHNLLVRLSGKYRGNTMLDVPL